MCVPFPFEGILVSLSPISMDGRLLDLHLHQ